MQEIFQRISVRRYESRPVARELVEQVIRAAMAAPSAGNQQPWEFYVVTDPQKLAELSAVSPYASCLATAPVGIAAVMRSNVRWPEYCPQDMAAAAQNLLLEACSLGLGSVWLGIAPLKDRMDKTASLLGLPEDHQAFALFPLGWPAEARPQEDRFRPERIHWDS